VQSTGDLFIYFLEGGGMEGGRKCVGQWRAFAIVADPLRCMNRKLGQWWVRTVMGALLHTSSHLFIPGGHCSRDLILFWCCTVHTGLYCSHDPGTVLRTVFYERGMFIYGVLREGAGSSTLIVQYRFHNIWLLEKRRAVILGQVEYITVARPLSL
jgi:hypothetical protein